MTNKPEVIKKLSFVLVVFLMLFVLGCTGIETEIPLPPTQEEPPNSTATHSPTPEQASQNSAITLPDGSLIILSPDSQIEVVQQLGLSTGVQEIILTLVQGKILVAPDSKAGTIFTVQATAGYTARTSGCAMVVDFRKPFTFELTCIGGDCEMGESPYELNRISPNHIWEYQVSTLTDNGPIDLGALQKDYGGNLPECVINPQARPTSTVTATTTPTPTRTLTPTLDLAATATEACLQFQEEFPATPCP
jgi:hypothetical protein